MIQERTDLSFENIDVRKPMRSHDWEEIENWYLAEVLEIDIPEELNPATLLQINSKLSRLFTKSRFDYAFLKRQYEKIKRQVKRAEKQAYLLIKDSAKNDKDRESLVNQYLEDNAVFNYPISIYDAMDRIEERVLFMEAVVDDIQSKASRLITANGGLKLELEVDR
jgi:hypothetical protein